MAPRGSEHPPVSEMLDALGAVGEHMPSWSLGQVLNLASRMREADIKTLAIVDDDTLLDRIRTLESAIRPGRRSND